MLQFFRSFLKSKVGAIVGLAVLALIAVAFVTADISGGGLGASGSSGQVAKVGNKEVTSAELNREANEALQRVRQQDPTMSMSGLIARGGLDIILNDLIDLKALFSFGDRHGIVAGDRLIDSELQRAGAIQPQGIARDMVAQRLVARQLLAPAEHGAVLPREMAWRYAQLLGERRTGSIAILPSMLFAPEGDPDPKALAAYYAANTNAFIRPERRVIRYATFGADAVKNVAAPTEAEIAGRFNADKAQYGALEKRRITQLVVPTEAAAKAVVAEVAEGKSFEASASEKGLSTANLGPMSKTDLVSQTSSSIADAAFGAPQGKLALAQSPLGWHVLRVDAIEQRPARTLDQVKGEIASALSAEKRRSALSDMIASIEEQFEEGASLPEAAKSLGLQVQATPQITADGTVYQQPGQSISPALQPVLQTAFTMQENEPQVAEAEPGVTFVIYEVTDIAASAPAPLREITEDVKAAYRLDQGAAAAKAQAQKIMASVRKGEKLEAAVARLGKQLPPVERVGMTRPQMMQIQQSGQPVPPPIRLLFAMASGSVKVQEAPQQRGWFVVVLDNVEPGKIERNAPAVAQTQRELGQVAGSEYSEALRKAITQDAGVKRNEAAIKAVRDQLTGANGN